MFAILHSLAMFVIDFFKSPHRLQAENLFLRHQLRLKHEEPSEPPKPLSDHASDVVLPATRQNHEFDNDPRYRDDHVTWRRTIALNEHRHEQKALLDKREQESPN